MENIHKFSQYTHFLSITKNDLSSLNNLFMVSCQLIRMLSYAKNKHQMCWVTQHQYRSRQMWKIFTNSPRALTFVCYKNDLYWLNNPFMASFNSFVCPLMLRTNNRCVESLNISVEIAKCGKFSQIHPEHSLLSTTKNDSSRVNNLYMVSFQHIRMSSSAKKKQQMCSVTQHQCRSRQMWNIFTNSPSTLTFCLLQKND